MHRIGVSAVFFAHKPRQIGCVGFVRQGWVRAQSILSRDTERNRASCAFRCL